MPKGSFNRMRAAVRKQFSLVKQSTRPPEDQDLQIYRNLSSDAFDQIAEKYGADEMFRYRRVMEAKLENSDS